MKKIILTLVALLVSAVMVLAFAGCAAKEAEEASTSDNGAVVTTIENVTVADVTEADSTSSFVA